MKRKELLKFGKICSIMQIITEIFAVRINYDNRESIKTSFNRTKRAY